ncbi:MAG: hypothetical protein GY869_16415 [Planctomycetes bacterium]|nr:hypothetical protein [Planctomycetota bacterium]
MLQNLQALPSESGDSAMIIYRRPDFDVDESVEVVFYERYDKWEEDGVVVCFADSHCEIITDRQKFEELIK